MVKLTNLDPEAQTFPFFYQKAVPERFFLFEQAIPLLASTISLVHPG
jgi:hypothetical protein